MLTFRLLSTFALLCLVGRPALAAQAEDPSNAPMTFEKGTIEITVLGGTSLPVSALEANADHSLTLASLAIGRVMTGGPNGNNLQLILDVSPFIHVRQPEAVMGWSFSPLVIRWNLPPAGERGVRFFAEVSGGLLFTTEPVPVRTTKFNFIDQAGLGIRIEESAHRAWLIGYRFQHVSNGGRVKPNPGANFNLVYAGVSFIR